MNLSLFSVLSESLLAFKRLFDYSKLSLETFGFKSHEGEQLTFSNQLIKLVNPLLAFPGHTAVNFSSYVQLF